MNNSKPTGQELYELYVTQRMSVRQIGRQIQTSATTVRQWLRQAGIQTRSISEAKQGIAPLPYVIAASVAKRRKRFLPGREAVGYKVNGYGYVEIWNPEAQDYEYEHRLVLEKKLGRKLRHDEDAHHINGIRTDNRPENLELKESRSEHQRHHSKTRLRRPDGSFAGEDEPGATPIVGRRPCLVPNCNLPHKARGLCNAHWFWARNHNWATPSHLVGTGHSLPRKRR
jgi:hypothetical protein